MSEAIKTAKAFMWVTLMPDARTDWSLSLTPRRTRPMSWLTSLLMPKRARSMTTMMAYCFEVLDWESCQRPICRSCRQGC